MNRKSFRPFLIGITAFFALCLFFSPKIFAQTQKETEKSWIDLIETFNRTRNLSCGQRAEAIRVGREIVQSYAKQTADYPFVNFVIKQIPYLEIEEERCKNNLPETNLAADWEKFKTATKAPCGQREQAVRLANYILVKHEKDEINREILDYLKKQTPKIEADDKVCRKEYSLENLLALFRTHLKAGCGKRVDALRTGKKILELHGADEANQEVILLVEKEIPKIEGQDYICQRNERYNEAYRLKNWRLFLAFSKQIIAEEGNTPLALDVMLTFAAVGQRLTAYEGENLYNADTVFYAKKALDLIESGTETQARWGIFEPFKSKENALGWLNYITGYISYFRLNEDKKAIPYFYEATRHRAEFKYDAFIYHAVAIHYFDRQASSISNLTINDFVFRANTLVNPIGELTGNSFGDASSENEIIALYKNLVNLYNLRYNLAANENPLDLANYIQILINKPLIDPSAGVKKRK